MNKLFKENLILEAKKEMRQLLLITKPGKKLAVQASQGNEFTVTGYVFQQSQKIFSTTMQTEKNKKKCNCRIFQQKGSSLNQSP